MSGKHRLEQEQWDGIRRLQRDAHNSALRAVSACAAASAEREEALANYETEYEMVPDVDPETGDTRFYLPSTYRWMLAARIRRDKKRALRRGMREQGIPTGLTIL